MNIRLLVLVLTSAACHPSLPPVSGCAPFTQRCNPDGLPESCSASLRWEPQGDANCPSLGEVCAVDPNGHAHCALSPDGGVQVDGGAR